MIMLARQMLIAVMALATLPYPHAPQEQANPVRTLLAPAPLSDEITALTVTEYLGRCAGIKPRLGTGGGPPCIQVKLNGPAVHDGASSPNPLSVRTTQVWLLRKDGTAVGMNLIQPMNAMWSGDIPFPYGMVFTFEAVPPQELAGVVVSVNGKLYVREIKANPAS
jgi:hypothetical protein